MSFKLTVAAGKEAGKELVFDQPSVLIGRTPDCDVILYDPGVSRKHARIYSEGDAYFVEDMGSSNGTRVNGSTIRKHLLSDGDSVSLGPVVFSFSSKVTPEDAGPSPDVRVDQLSTRIVRVGQIKRQRNEGVALLSQGVDVEALSRSTTATMQALERSSGNVSRARRPSPPVEDGPSALARPGRAITPPVGRALPRRGTPPDDGAPDEALARPRPRAGALSAAERARTRRDSKGMVADLRIFWLEASTATRAALSVMVAAMALGLLGVGWYFGLRDTVAGPAHPEPAVLTRQPVQDSFGLGEGVTWRRPDMKTFDFEFNVPVRAVVLLHFQAKDVSQGEVAITLNGVDVGTVPADTIDSAERSHELILPPATLKKGAANQVTFDNTKNPPNEDPWRIWNVWIETALLPELPPDLLLIEANKAFQRAQLLFERRDVGAENRYMAWKTYKETWLMLEASPDPKPELYPLARDKVREAQHELDRICAKLLLEEESYYNQKDWNGARSTLDHIRAYFPGNDQPCAFRAEQKRDEHGL